MRTPMKKIATIGLLAIVALFVIKSLMPAKVSTQERADFDLRSFGRLPVLEGGRIKPLDTVARNALVLFRGKQTALDADGHRLPAVQWFAMTVLADPAALDAKIFRVDDPGVLGLLGSTGEDVVHFSVRELQPHLSEISRQAQLAPENAQEQNRYQKAVIKLSNSIAVWNKLAATYVAPSPMQGIPPTALYQRFGQVAPAGMMALHSVQLDAGARTPEVDQFLAFAGIFQQIAEGPALRLIPAPSDAPQPWKSAQWNNLGVTLLETVRTNQVDPIAMGFAELATAWNTANPAAFNQAVAAIDAEYHRRISDSDGRVGFELFFNNFQPFYVSLVLYLISFLVVCVAWMGWPWLQRIAFHIMVIAAIIHTFGMAARVYLSGYAPVTNLYSSAVFVGWTAVLFALPLERLFRNGLATVSAAAIGFCSLVIAHNLAVSGGTDTMEMMRAVLDSNFWLSTHVTTITLGYSATFLAGFLGLIYVVRGLFTTTLDKATASSLERMTYGVCCFALLFSFVGTVLGGIWADQSWGRFWGWDPKENGALMIVIWLALALHARRIKMCGQRGFMLLAIGGNIITSWSWFGTNMLGVGLHSYGFMDKAFFWLISFWGSQLLFILAGGMTPLAKWRSAFSQSA